MLKKNVKGLKEDNMRRNQKRNEQGVVSNFRVPMEVLGVNLSSDFDSKSKEANTLG